MKRSLKPSREQVIVITGARAASASSRRRQAARARRPRRPRRAQRSRSRACRRRHPPRAAAARSMSWPTSPTRGRSKPSPTRRSRAFGRIDTWVNNAAVSMYGRLAELRIEDMRRQIDVNYWGQVTAPSGRPAPAPERRCAHQRRQRAVATARFRCRATTAPRSTRSRRSPTRCGWSSRRGAPISVTLVKPASIDTPFFEKARTYWASSRSRCRRSMRRKSWPTSSCTRPQHPRARTHRRRRRREAQRGAVRPALADQYMERWTFDSQSTDIRAVTAGPTTCTSR